MYRLSSSIRTRSAEDSLILASTIAEEMGVTRVTDITWLDKIGVPVYAGIRPFAAKGSLNVHNGKGMRPNEAKIGAFMESIEFSLAEGMKHQQEIKKYNIQEIQNSLPPGLFFSSFGAKLGVTFTSDEEIYCVTATDIISGQKGLIPAELVFHPVNLSGQRSLYGGTTTNGLCSGNTKLEAAIHGVCEVLERDVKSFDIINNDSCLVDISTEPESIKALRKKIEDAGLVLALRKTNNEFNLPYFSAFILEPDNQNPISVADGYGFHPIAEIAATRAITEAAQSRLTHIHGGRDDIVKRIFYYQKNQHLDEKIIMDGIRKKILSPTKMASFIAADEEQYVPESVETLWHYIKEKMALAGFHHCFVYELSPEDFPFSVLRVVIPKAEFIESEMKRIGPRFLDAFQRREKPNKG
ncbi:YcaO-like family protein [Buttiauxella ferragutiae]|uniref:YcaO-like family protein n=1 Tax=Buttiauxella ferragutiae TaxID=82989 RepID=UPI0035267CA9